MRFIDCKLEAVKLFEKALVPDAAVDAEYLMLEAAKMSRSRFFTEQFEEIPDEIRLEFEKLVERRCKHEPLQYILGSQDFCGYEFKCSPNVLIPRLDTEVLVENAVKRAHEFVEKRNLDKGKLISKTADNAECDLKFLDICTGSGCIPVSVVKLCEEKYGYRIDCTATDISDYALALAKENAQNLSADIKIIKSDLWENIEGRFDIITSNPPYIESDVIPGLMPEVAKFEPMLALDGGADGLVFYRRLVDKAAEFLNENGWLLMEIGDTQGEAVSDLMLAAGFRNIGIIKDYAGLDRVVEGQL